MKTGPDALGTDENVSDSAKQENGTRCPPYRRKRVRACKTRKRDQTHSAPAKTSPGTQNIKTGPDALKTAENESGRTEHENGTWERKTSKWDPTPSEPPKTSPDA
jgi:hypothetical protein